MKTLLKHIKTALLAICILSNLYFLKGWISIPNINIPAPILVLGIPLALVCFRFLLHCLSDGKPNCKQDWCCFSLLLSGGLIGAGLFTWLMVAIFQNDRYTEIGQMPVRIVTNNQKGICKVIDGDFGMINVTDQMDGYVIENIKVVKYKKESVYYHLICYGSYQYKYDIFDKGWHFIKCFMSNN